MTNTEAKVIEVLAEHLDMDASEMTTETTFEDLGVDSLDVAEIVMEMQDVFDIEIETEKVGKSVKEVAAYIDGKVNA